MAFAIMRCKKLVTMGNVASSLKHCYRERETPNADSARTPENDHREAKGTDEAMGKLRALLPEKRRKDAVLAVEYLMTASPEWWKTATQDQQKQFFDRSLKWLGDKYGADRIVTATVHRDETSPHLSAFVVPLTKDGRLSAKDYIGNKSQMSQDQTAYAEAVRDLGLERGIERSKATHTTIRDYYSRVASPTPLAPSVSLPEPKTLESKQAYGKRVAEAVLGHIKPTWNALLAKETALDAAKQEAGAAKATAKHHQVALERAQGAQKILATMIGGLTKEQQQAIIQSAQKARAALHVRNQRHQKPVLGRDGDGNRD